jgi:type IV pilus secretin PilQ/predicted competence protein
MASGLEVSVETLGGSTVVSLKGLVQPVFTAFALQNPDRVVVDLVSLPPVAPMEPVTVQDGLVEQVSVSAFATGIGDAMTRVEVLLTVPADFSVVAHDHGLSVEVVPLMGSADAGDSGEDTPSDDPWAMEMEHPTEPEPLITWNAQDATRLLAVDVEDTGDGALIHLRGDGSIASAVTFTLEDPARLVVDLPDLVNEIEKGSIDVDLPQARRVRVGQHAGMVRVVIDAGDAAAPFESRMIIPAPDGLAIALGDGESMDAAIAMIGISTPSFDEPEAFDLDGLETGAPEMAGVPGGAESSVDGSEADWPELAAGDWPAATDGDVWEEAANGDGELAQADDAAPADGLDRVETADGALVTIYGVEFDNQAERDRIVIVGDRPVDYVVYEPNPETVVLSFSNAEIDPAAEVRIAPEVSGPVSLVTAFSQPGTESPEVRVVVQRASGLMPDITRRGPMLFVDFPRTATAARPPILLVEPGAMDDPEAEWVAEETFVEDPGPETVPEFVPDATEVRDAPVVAAVGVPEPGGLSVSDLPPIPASIMPATMGGGAPPASLEPPAAIDLLQEGGLINGKEYVGRRISLDFKEVDIADVLRLIAEVSDLNVIAGDEVKGNVTIRLVDVPWDQALDVILLTKNLGFMRIGNVLRVAPAGVIKSEEESRLQERRAKEKLEDLIVKLQPVNYANVGDMSSMIQRLLTARGTVNTDTRTNTLIIKDIPSVIAEATALVKAIDTQTPQVMIEAKIVEASLDFSREFGSVWSMGSQPLVDGFNPGSGDSRDLGYPQFRLHDVNNFSSMNPITAGPTALANLGAFLLDERINLDVQLQAAEVNGDGKVISSPRIVTLDNTEAKIEQGVSIPFQTFENGDAALEFVDAVLSLKVKPHITADRSIIMEIEVSRNAPDDSVFTLTGSPAIAKNQVKTETLVKDGRTLVLGGIYVIDKSQRQSRVPYLHKIPILGAAFRSDEISDSRKELLIFVTPTIITTTPILGM